MLVPAFTASLVFACPPNQRHILSENLYVDTAPNLMPAGLFALQGRYLGLPR
jgi:hypothetical protein